MLVGPAFEVVDGLVGLLSCRLRLFDRNSNDGPKLVGLQAGTANEGTVYVGLTKQSGGILRIDAASILNDHRLRRFAEHLSEALSDHDMLHLRLLRSGVVAGIADGPDWFVGDA